MSSPGPDIASFTFGHYAIQTRADGQPEELGRGAMGITYKAMDTTLERCVALKIINPEQIVGEETRQRFLREARVAAQLRHPNVAGVFHLGVEGGTHFYAMEFDPLKKQAEGGDRAAMVCYAMALDQGLGTDINPSEARRWYVKAATLGDSIAQQWCYEHHVGFQMSGNSGTVSTLVLPHNVTLGKRTPGLGVPKP